MKTKITYNQISHLVQYVNITSDMVHCHFHCPVKSKKIVSISRLSMFDKKEAPEPTGFVNKFKSSNLFGLKDYFRSEIFPEPIEDTTSQQESAVVHAFGKISERFMWSDEHRNFIYRF